MTESQRLRSTAEGLRLVSAVAGELARRGGGQTNVLAVTTYFPVDVDSVARVFEGIEEIDGVERIERGPLTVYEIDNGERFSGADVDIDDENFLERSPAFLRVVGMLKGDPAWIQKVQRQHELLHMLSGADEEVVDLSYLTSRASMSRAQIQSILNDFDAAGYIGVEFDEDVDKLRYTIPEIDYPEERLERNMARLEQVEPPARSRVSLWVVLAAIGVIVLMAIIVLRWY